MIRPFRFLNFDGESKEEMNTKKRKNATPPSKHLITWSLLWGGLLSIGFYGAVQNGVISNPLVLQYCTAHPIEYVIVIMFFVGLAFLGVKYFELLCQRAMLGKGEILPARERERVPVGFCTSYQELLEEHLRNNKGKTTYHTDRLHAALVFLRAGGDPEMLDMELRYMSDDDMNAADGEYGFVRTILWAVPMLGFLGTVVGITQALGNLDLNAINESSKALSTGLSVAFDTTALAIGLDLVLYFFQFLTYRKEMQMLRDVDRMLEQELRGRFLPDEDRHAGNTGEIVAVRKMLSRVVDSLEGLTRSQTEIWNRALGTANDRFATLAAESALMVKSALASAMNETAVKHTEGFAALEKRLHEEMRTDTLRFTDGLRANVEALVSLQNAITSDTEAAKSATDAASRLTVLEERLNANLAALAQVGDFEQTVHSLSAAIHLLNSKYNLTIAESVNLRTPKAGNAKRENDGETGEKGYAA